MKNLIFMMGMAATMVCSFCACRPKTDVDGMRKELMTLHNQVMNEDEEAGDQKTALDSLAKANTAAADSASFLSKKLAAISDNMMDWMHQFEPEQHTKSPDEQAMYLTAQKKQLLQLDSSYKALIKETSAYLKKQNIKTQTNMQGMKM